MIGQKCDVLYYQASEERRNRQDLTEIYKINRGFTKLNISELFAEDSYDKGTRGNSQKLEKMRSARDSRDIRKYFFSHRVAGGWNALDQHTWMHLVSVPSRGIR